MHSHEWNKTFLAILLPCLAILWDSQRAEDGFKWFTSEQNHTHIKKKKALHTEVEMSHC